MAEYVFPKSYSYTEGSGSGSGSGETFVSCSDCGLPPGTSLDTHYLNTAALVPASAVGVEACCPAVPRETTKECDDCGLPPGLSLDNYYIDTNHRVSIDATGQDACCPAKSRNNTKPCFPCPVPYDPATQYIETTGLVPIEAEGIYACCSVLPLDNQSFPCVYRPLPEGYDPLYFYVDANATFLAPNVDCPVRPYNYNPNDCDPPCDEILNFYCLNGVCVYSPTPPTEEDCDPSCSGCSECYNGACVDIPKIPCEVREWTLSDGSTSIFPEGYSVDDYYVDTTEKNCPLEIAMVPTQRFCPVLPRDLEDDTTSTTSINVPAGQINTIVARPNILKTGPGTLVIQPNMATAVQSLIIDDGQVLCRAKEVLGPTTVICLGPKKPTSQEPPTLNLSNLSETISVGRIQFGYKKEQTVSFTSSTEDYSGKVELGFGGLNISDVPSLNEIRSLLIAGRNEGEWDGSYGFVTSKNIGGIKNIGYNYNSEDNSVLIKWASSGDTNLDGIVDILDVANILSSNKYDSGATDAQWIDGDFNYDGMIDILDIALFLSAGNFDKGNYLPQDVSFDISFNPPTSITGDPIVVSTETKEIFKDGVRVYQPSITDTQNREFNMICRTLTKSVCESFPLNYFSGQSTCHDSACDINIALQKAQIR